VDGAGGGARGNAEFVAQSGAKVGVDAKGFGDVALGCEGAHQQLMAAFAQRSPSDQFPRGTYRASELGPPETHAAGGVAFESAQVDVGDARSLLQDPRRVVVRKKLALAGKERDQRRPPRAPPVTDGDGGLGAVNGFGGGFDVDPRVAEPGLQRGPPLDGGRAERPAELGNEGIERALGGGRRVGPDGVDQLGSPHGPVPVGGQVGEEELALLPGQQAVEPLPLLLDDERAAQLDPERWGGGHATIVATGSGPGWRRGAMARVVRCECGFVARGDSEEEVVESIRGHLRTDHPALLDSVTREDIVGWVQVE